MAVPIKACVIGGLGCVASIAYGLSQAESSLSVREKLAFEGYVLISEKEKEDEIWKERANLYKEDYSNLSLDGLDHENIETNWTKLKDECAKYIEKGIATNKLVKEGVYAKLTKLCTLTIKEYIESHLNTKDEQEKIIAKTNENAWDGIYHKYKTEISKEITTIREGNHKEELNKHCEKIFKFQRSNENKDQEYQASQWCVERKEPPADKAEEEDSDSDSD